MHKPEAPHAVLELNVKNIKNNFNYFRSKLKSTTKLMILVKANSYGHGDVEFARVVTEAGADYLGVATPYEGIRLKNCGYPFPPILVLTPGTESFEELIDNEVEFTISNFDTLEKVVEVLKSKEVDSFPVHIAVDSGMHRIGFQEWEIKELSDRLKMLPQLHVKSIYSHLAASDEPQHDEFTLRQIESYTRAAYIISSKLPYIPMRHILNSAGIERFPQYQFDMARLGIGIYGISAIGSDELKPSAYFKAPIIQINVLKRGDGTVGYGRYGVLEHDVNRIAVLPVGYADGVDRHLGRGRVCFEGKGHMVPTIGNICMDMTMVDITGTDLEIGDMITIFGDKPHAKELAEILETIPYEIFTSVGSRVKKCIFAEN